MNDNYVSDSKFVEIKKGQTAIIVSKNCKETMVLINVSDKPFGVGAFIMREGNDLDKINKICKKSGFPDDFVYLNLDENGETFFYMECAKDTLPKALCAKEIEEDGELQLKLCIVFVKDYKKEEQKQDEQEYELTY